jgi:hypothetical protein
VEGEKGLGTAGEESEDATICDEMTVETERARSDIGEVYIRWGDVASVGEVGT